MLRFAFLVQNHSATVHVIGLVPSAGRGSRALSSSSAVVALVQGSTESDQGRILVRLARCRPCRSTAPREVARLLGVSPKAARSLRSRRSTCGRLCLSVKGRKSILSRGGDMTHGVAGRAPPSIEIAAGFLI